MNEAAAKVLSDGGVMEIPSVVTSVAAMCTTNDATTTTNTSSSSSNVDYMSILESWIGLSPTSTSTTNNMTRTGTTFTSSSITSAAVESEMLLMEDMAPFEIQFYQSVVELLIQVWKPTNNNNENYYDGVVFSGGVTTMMQQLHNNNNNKQSLITSNNNNVLFVEKSSSPSAATTTTTKDKDDDDDVISLYDVMESVRVTRLLRYWMDLNVQGGQTMAEESSKTLIDYLLETQQQSSTSSTQSSSSPLIQALYYHIRELPQLQSQIHVYTQSLMRGGGSGGHPGSDHTIVSSSNTGHQQQPFNPKSRLQQYQQAQQVSSKLNSEWEDHLQSLEQIVSDVYSNGDTNQRKQCRSLLGSVWSQFVTRSASSTSGGGGSSSSSAVKMENTSSSGIQMTLRVLHRILLGIKKPTIANATTTTATNSNLLLLPKSYEHLLTYHLIPLHKPNSMVLWRDQTSLLELYHEPLVQCIAILLQKKPDLIPKVIGSLIEPDIWTKGGNTPKLVLLLHEIDTYIGIIPTTTTETTDTDDDMMNTSSSKKSSSSQTTTIVTTLPNMDNVVFPNLLKTLGICMSSDHSRLAERALSYMKNTKFQLLLEKNFERSMKILLPFLVRSEPAWNPTVRKMTWTVLKKFCDYDQATLVKVSNQYFPPPPPPSSSNSNNNNNNTTILPVPRPVVQGTAKNEIKQTHAAPPKDFTLKSAMGGWKPPSGSGGGVNRNSSGMMPPPPGRAARGGGRGRGGAGAAPPLAVTGVAPWAMNNQTSTMSLPSRTSKNPPLGVTGVAPWAMKQQSSTNNSNRTAGATQTTTKRSAGEALSLPGVVEEQGKRQHHQQTSSGGDSNNDKGYVPRVLSYMEEIKPPEQDEDGSSWSKVQMAETPTLLPNLKFHDLVFGHDLGEGAFGSVRYARLIDRMKTRSQWPEYAVKVISTEKIREMGYEASAQRELAILRVLSHPGIARLVSSFRFREGVYLVLEYASGGDIHSLLRRNGSIDNESTRFVIGEVIAALASIHELGLVYADLKPENIVITESGHIKLTDFGGCRPVTSEAKALINISAKNNTLHGLRDGDWKPQQKQQQRQQGNEESNGWSLMEVDNEDECEDGNDDVTPMDVNNETADDLRIEGTTAYLPPEVVMGGFPTRSADSWALGCVLYQCLTGRPPILEADEALTKKRIVSFGDDSSSSPSSSQKKNDKAQLFEDSHAVHITAEARDLICSLLQQNPVERPSMNQAGQHDFFRLAGMDVFSLHRQPAHPLDVGDVSPVADAQWSRRQFSSIWAPQPQAYDISMTGLDDSNKQRRGDSWSGPIAEGDEATSFFSKIGSMSSSFGDNTTSLKIPLPTMAATSTIEEDKIATS